MTRTMPAARPPIPLADYQRLFRVMKTVFDAGNIAPAHASILFSVAGAQLIEQLYKKKCQPVAGTALYRLGDDAGAVLTFTGEGGNQDDFSPGKGFHCWIVCGDWVIDFMAPLFREALQKTGFAGNCPRQMFQKPRAAMADSPLLMRKAGDFYMLPDVDLTRKTLQQFLGRDDVREAIGICLQWYRKPPRDIPRKITIQYNNAGEDGATAGMTLDGTTLGGIW